jgi:hypothetical protein
LLTTFLPRDYAPLWPVAEHLSHFLKCKMPPWVRKKFRSHYAHLCLLRPHVDRAGRWSRSFRL